MRRAFRSRFVPKKFRRNLLARLHLNFFGTRAPLQSLTRAQVINHMLVNQKL